MTTTKFFLAEYASVAKWLCMGLNGLKKELTAKDAKTAEVDFGISEGTLFGQNNIPVSLRERSARFVYRKSDP